MRIDTTPNVELFKLGRGHQLFELVILYHLLYDIQTTYEFAFDDDLWESRPVVQLFESCKKFSFPLVNKVRGILSHSSERLTLPDAFVCQDIKMGKLDILLVQ